MSGEPPHISTTGGTPSRGIGDCGERVRSLTGESPIPVLRNDGESGVPTASTGWSPAFSRSLPPEGGTPTRPWKIDGPPVQPHQLRHVRGQDPDRLLDSLESLFLEAIRAPEGAVGTDLRIRDSAVQMVSIEGFSPAATSPSVRGNAVRRSRGRLSSRPGPPCARRCDNGRPGPRRSPARPV